MTNEHHYRRRHLLAPAFLPDLACPPSAGPQVGTCSFGEPTTTGTALGGRP